MNLPSMLTELGVAVVWQAAVVAAVVAVAMRSTRRASAARRFQLWMIGFVAAAVLPIAVFAVRMVPVREVSGTPAAAAHALLMLDPRWSVVAVAVWGVVAAAGCLRVLVGLVGVRRLVRRADLVACDVPEVVAARVRVMVSDEVAAPVAAGFWHRAIVLPRSVVALDDAELRPVLLHELEHLLRRDDWTMLLVRVLRSLLPMSVALGWMERVLDREREMACDEAVLRREVVPTDYAMCLARMAERSLQSRVALMPGLLGRLGEQSQLARRVGNILSFSAQERRVRPVVAAVSGVLVLAGAVALGVGLGECPSLVGFAEPVASHVVAAKAEDAPKAVEVAASMARAKPVRRVHRRVIAPQVVVEDAPQLAEVVPSEKVPALEMQGAKMTAVSAADEQTAKAKKVQPQPVLVFYVDPFSGLVQVAIMERGEHAI